MTLKVSRLVVFEVDKLGLIRQRTMEVQVDLPRPRSMG